MIKPTVTIGIIAYNEEKNIEYLIRDLLSQTVNNFSLEKIIVLSDGSKDFTVERADKIRTKIIKIVAYKKRKGLAYRINQLTKQANSDILVLLNADIRIDDKLFMRKLVYAIRENDADLVSPKAIELPAKNFLEKAIYASMQVKNYIFEHYNSGSNVFTCKGMARAFSKHLYKRIKFKYSIGEDAYSYFYCLKYKFRFLFIDNTYFWYKLPSDLFDHKAQSDRFFKSQNILNSDFDNDLIKSSYHLPFFLTIKAVTRYLFKFHIYLIAYPFLIFYTKFTPQFSTNSLQLWRTVKSSKLLR